MEGLGLDIVSFNSPSKHQSSLSNVGGCFSNFLPCCDYGQGLEELGSYFYLE